MNAIDPAKLAELEAAVASDPGAPGFAVLAEVRRREGSLDEASEIACVGLERAPDDVTGRLVLALVRMDQGREADAREELSRVLDDRLSASGLSRVEAPPSEAPAAPPAGVSDAELEMAFDEAETDAARMITPNRVAEEALAAVDAGAAEGLDESVLEPGSAFATATMAELLARQGDAQGAERIRASLGAAPELRREPQPPSEALRGRVTEPIRQRRIARLERWLANIRGGRS